MQERVLLYSLENFGKIFIATPLFQMLGKYKLIFVFITTKFVKTMNLKKKKMMK